MGQFVLQPARNEESIASIGAARGTHLSTLTAKQEAVSNPSDMFGSIIFFPSLSPFLFVHTSVCLI